MECWCVAWWGPPPDDCPTCWLDWPAREVSARGTSNRDDRGSSHDRRRRRQWLLQTFGDGATAPCWSCGTPLDESTITVDRIVPGCRGGTYVRSNIRPACGACNSKLGGGLRKTPGQGLDEHAVA